MNYIEAQDAIYSQFVAAWNDGAQIAANLPYVPTIYFHNVGKSFPEDASRVWCRISTQQVTAPQSAFAQNAGRAGARRYTIDGLIFVQLFAPKQIPGASDILNALAVLAQNTFRRSASSDLVLRNSRIDDSIPPDKENLRSNVIAEYEHDETF